MPYADASTQTVWAGLTKGDLPMVPAHHLIRMQPRIPTLLERRGNNPDLARGIPLPGASTSHLGDDLTASPPPTHAGLSPLPAANKLYAGHTPLLPRSPSPDNDNDLPVNGELVVEPEISNHDINDESSTPEQDPSLAGALSLPTLPTHPVDGADEHIVLSDLDHALAAIAREQERFSKLRDAPEPASASASASASATLSPRQATSTATASSEDTTDDGLSLSRKGSADSRSSHVSYVNGIPLKSPPLNFGVPMGQLSRE
ncbi:hypothetical protein NX059_000204 [Plenodomus lindquistii]|nr:hypothetical protein NX059_000204 [Plenodomus lindquistii]